MKADISQHKRKLAQAAETSLPHLMVGFRTGDFQSLGKLCNAINVLAEFYDENRDSELAQRVPKLVTYIDGKFKECLVLILKSDERYYGYTANNVTKFIRGESLHGASENLDGKRRALHDYIFEKDHTVECEFQISWNWIVGPNLRAASGNLDTGGAFVHAINLNGNRIEVSQIESIVLAIAYELWQANTNGQPNESTKCFVQFNPSWYAPVWGENLASKLGKHLTEYLKLELPAQDRIAKGAGVKLF